MRLRKSSSWFQAFLNAVSQVKWKAATILLVKWPDLPVEIVEEGKEVEGQLAPGLFLAVTQGICVHDCRWIIRQLWAICWATKIPERAGEDTWHDSVIICVKYVQMHTWLPPSMIMEGMEEFPFLSQASFSRHCKNQDASLSTSSLQNQEISECGFSLFYQVFRSKHFPFLQSYFWFIH